MNSLDKKYFDDVYQAREDPWEFETSSYEQGKYDDTIASLPRESYISAFEIGCSIGVLTEKLTRKCAHILAIDVTEKPIERARKRLAAIGSVEFKVMSVPAEFPKQNFDLILLSEVGYYFSSEDLQKLQVLIADHLSNSGHVLLVHWTPQVHDYPHTGDEVHESFQNFAEISGRLTNIFSKREEKYRIDLFEKV